VLKVLLILAVAVLPATALGHPAAGTDIHGVDFRNFTYKDVCGPEGGSTTVKDGSYSVQNEADFDKVYFEITDVVYGDVTGDGSDDALVLTLCNTGGTGNFTDGLLFTMRAGKPTVIARLGVGDRADGGIHSASINGGRLLVDRYVNMGGGACCPEAIETYSFKWNGRLLAQIGAAPKRSYQWYGSSGDETPQRVKFLKGTSSATLGGSTVANEAYVLGARANQAITVRFTTKDPNASAAILTPSGELLGKCTPGATWSGALPVTGDYSIRVSSTTSSDDPKTAYDLDLGIK